MMSKVSNIVDVYVGARLRMRRTMLGISQSKLGELLGVTFQQIQKYEKGSNPHQRKSSAAYRARARSLRRGISSKGVSRIRRSQVPLKRGSSQSYVVDFLASTEGLQLNRRFCEFATPKCDGRLLTSLLRWRRHKTGPSKDSPVR